MMALSQFRPDLAKAMNADFGDYVEMYGGLDYKGAVVLDIGADHGSTAAFFLGRGAAHVFASEINPHMRERLALWAKEKPVTVVEALSQGNAAAMLAVVVPDVVKVDCEGCEWILQTLPDEVLALPRGWVMETHTDAGYSSFIALFDRLGYRVTTVCDWGPVPNKSGKTCRVIQATKGREG